MEPVRSGTLQQTGTLGPDRRISGVPIRGAGRRRRETWFFLGMAVAAAVAVVAGFYPTFFRPMAAGEYTAGPLVYLHAALFFAWIALFLVQPALIRTGRVGVHRSLGYAGALLALGMVVIGVTVGLTASARGVAAGEVDARPFLLITLTDMLLFAVLVGSAVAARTRPQTHKRLMLLATAALMPAAFGRLFWFGLGIEHPIAMHVGADSFLAAGVAHDLWTRGRVHSAYLWGGGFLLAVHVIRLLLAESQAWAFVADRILSLM